MDNVTELRKRPDQIAAEYKARGWKPIPIAAGEKGPRDNDWQTRNYDPREFVANIGVQMGPVSAGLTDTDLDCFEAVALATHFLPPISATFGRPSKLRSHYLYIINDPDPKGVHKINDDEGKTIIELRMGGGGKGAQTVFPGSIHPSGEHIEWDQRGEPSRTSCAILKDAIKKIAVATLLARNWPASSRHDASLACGGFLARAGWEPEAVEDFMRSVQMVAGVHIESHIQNGCKAALDAANQYVAEQKGYGFPQMTKYFKDDVVKCIAKILGYREIDTDETLERMNEKYFVISLGNKARIGTFKFDPILKRHFAVFYGREDFVFLEDHPRITQGFGEKATKVSRGKWWLNQPLRTQYDGVVFAPAGPKVIENQLNLWRGWGIEPRQGNWRRLKRHIWKVLANRNRASFKYIMRWIAWSFKHPGEPAEVVLVFRGKSGTGKSLFGRAMCRAFGQHGLQISSPQHLTGRFNAHQADCAMLFADEAFWPGDKSAEGTLNRITSEDTIVIERKGIDVILASNVMKIIMASNNDWVVPVAIDDRRFAVFDVNPQYIQNEDYFVPLYREIEHGAIAAMMFDLLRMDLKGWHPRKNVPKTDALRKQKELSLKPNDAWWYAMLQSGCLPGTDADHEANPRRARSRLLFDLARKIVPELRYASDHILGRALGDRGCLKCQIRKMKAWQFPLLLEARAEWDKRFPGTEWDDMTEWGLDEGAF